MARKQLSQKEQLIKIAKYFKLPIVPYLKELFSSSHVSSFKLNEIEFKINSKDKFCYKIIRDTIYKNYFDGRKGCFEEFFLFYGYEHADYSQEESHTPARRVKYTDSDIYKQHGFEYGIHNATNVLADASYSRFYWHDYENDESIELL